MLLKMRPRIRKGAKSNIWNVKNHLFMLDIKSEHGNGNENFINKDVYTFF